MLRARWWCKRKLSPGSEENLKSHHQQLATKNCSSKRVKYSGYWPMFHRLRVQRKEVCLPKSKDTGAVELLLSSSVDPFEIFEEKPLISELAQNKAEKEIKGRNRLLRSHKRIRQA